MDVDSDTESDVFSMASLPSQSVSGSMASSYERDPDVRSASPVSVISISSSMRAASYREEYGRNLNNYSDIYRLPADDEELQRLDKQHVLLADVMGGKYAPPMAAVMANDVPGETKAVLDLGCGSGSWILDVARDFPDCSAVAVDLIPMQSPTMPPNLRSEIDDINLGLEHFYGDFNVVHARLISSGIKDYHLLVDQISRVLRPGGLIDVSEFDFHLYDKHHRRIELQVNEYGPPWFGRWITYMHAAVRNIGGDTDAATHLYEWISNNPRFEDVKYREFWLPVVPPPRDKRNETETLRRFEQKIGEDIKAFIGAGRPLLLGSGLTEEMMNELEANCMRELEERKITQYTRLQCVYARRKS
ncbi:S-adenosyl-L-methionine-dependent methyltransferase [Pholiota conissans]|uniref:S-adenosyl-L-methionine-dependent methyltransferase n=1 Tax=Pholiota conissans TaxID=109636 RepID=A0A9P5ZDN8_9AGAR|nr:S-adenosyl-L-methionine-dependent methyltransferase [Pholiota conissans]